MPEISLEPRLQAGIVNGIMHRGLSRNDGHLHALCTAMPNGSPPDRT